MSRKNVKKLVTTFLSPVLGNFDLIQSFLVDSMQIAFKKKGLLKVGINAGGISPQLDEYLVYAILYSAICTKTLCNKLKMGTLYKSNTAIILI